jgi:surface polysaccharide O-acyltransferase-like enzyme
MLLPVIGAFGDSHFIKTIGISDQGSWLTHRLSPLIALPAFALFLRLIKIPNSFFANFHLTQISRIADLSMGIYLLHPAVLEIYSLRHPFAGLMTTMPLAWISLSSLIILFTSIILVKLIKLIPFLNRTV